MQSDRRPWRELIIADRDWTGIGAGGNSQHFDQAGGLLALRVISSGGAYAETGYAWQKCFVP
jgi:hypothetical protein